MWITLCFSRATYSSTNFQSSYCSWHIAKVSGLLRPVHEMEGFREFTWDAAGFWPTFHRDAKLRTETLLLTLLRVSLKSKQKE